MPFVRSCPRKQARSDRITHLLNLDLGSLTITHPYHPLKGQSYDILKIKKINGERRYSLRVDNDVVCVPESWTDRCVAHPIDLNEDRPLQFNAVDLAKLAGLLRDLQK